MFQDRLLGCMLPQHVICEMKADLGTPHLRDLYQKVYIQQHDSVRSVSHISTRFISANSSPTLTVDVVFTVVVDTVAGVDVLVGADATPHFVLLSAL